jgi:sugar (pentulose or hexulose) kinase
MQNDIIIGIDAGTSVLKSVAFPDGGIEQDMTRTSVD